MSLDRYHGKSLIMKKHFLLAILALATSGAATQAAHTQAATTGAFVTTRGNDTVAVEQFTRTGNVLTGDYVTRPGGTTINHYVLHFDVNNFPSRLELTQQRADGKPVPNGPKSVVLTVGDKESTIVIQRDTAIVRKFAVSAPYPLLGTSLAMFEVAFVRLRGMKLDSTTFAGLPLNAPLLPDPIQVRFFAADSARVVSAEGPLFMRVDAAGRVLGLNATMTASPVRAERVASLDLRKLIAAFGAADAAGRGLIRD